MIMTAAAFDQVVSLLFLDDGVWQLKSGQIPRPGTASRSLAPMLEALELYDIAEPWVERESLIEREMDISRLMMPVRLIERSEVSSLIQKQDRMVVCS